METKISYKRILPFGIAALALSLVLIFYFISTTSTANFSIPINEQEVNSRLTSGAGLPEQVGKPVRLKIPAINADSAFEYVGLTPLGAMDVPKSPSNVAWYDLGPRPGESGNAVIAGHYGWKDGKPAVFDNLYKLQKGDKISVEGDMGAITIFVVRELRSYGEKQDASDVFTSKDGKAHLVLITCEGVWNKTQKSYSKRLVVFADKE